MSLTTDPNDPELGHGVDKEPGPQNKKYLILSEEERAKGFVRPLRFAYRHVGPPSPRFALRDLTDEEKKDYGQHGYVKFEVYPESESPKTGKFWTKADLEKVGKGCGVVTKMGQALSETYARQPDFYGATYCVGCSMHLPVCDFVWEGTEDRVGS